MRKPIYILNLLIILLVFSCGQNSSEKNLNGKWFEVENEYQTWNFYPDSLVFLENKVEWKASNSKIEFDYITYVWDSIGKQIDYQDKIIFNYQLNNDNDSLFGILENKYGKHKFSLLKAENYIEYLNKKFGIEFSLPDDNSAELLKNKARYGLKIFMGYSNNELVGRTELSESLNNLESDIEMFKDSIKPNTPREIERREIAIDSRFHLRVFADKRIPDSTITKYLSVNIKVDFSTIAKHLPKEFGDKVPDPKPIKIYRIYLSEEKETPNILNGKKIKTIANTIYSK